ncbi:hypothetical protein [Gaopeijia maritima]|uniref:Uncharacterized protein n=1 Tax=Gaopeijia maritima TaxID=3119007 RepID=A0ABU9E7K1_9BACT
MNRSTLILGALVLAAVALIVVDAADEPLPPAATAPAATPPPVPEGHPAMDGEPVRAAPLDETGASLGLPPDEPAGEPVREGAGRGRVLEVLPSASFTILRLDREGEEIWLTGPAVSVEVGQEVMWDSASIVHDFPSETAGRTFETLRFADGLRVSEGG